LILLPIESPRVEVFTRMRIASSIFLINALTLMMLAQAKCLSQETVKPVSSQEVFEHFDKLYKVDSRLVNGDFYQTPKMSETAGHPYFLNPEWKTGSVILEGINFDVLQLRYDIHSGQIILNTSEYTNSGLQLVLKKDRIESFMMEGVLYQPYPEDNTISGKQFCQVLVEGEVDFLIIKSKNLKVTSTGLSDFAYQELEQRVLRIHDELIPFISRRSLIKLYPEFKTAFKEYITRNRLKARKMSLSDQADLIAYCNTLIEQHK